MALADTAALIVDLSLKGNFQNQMKAASKSLKGFNVDLKNTEGRAFRAGQQIGTGIRNGTRIAAGAVGLLAANVALGLDSLVDLEKQTAQTNAVLKSTKGVAGVTADAVARLSEKYEALNATIGDEVIRSTQNLLLTFTDIRKDAFEPTLLAILNMNTAMGGDENSLQARTLQVGKAMQDPVKGITALRKAGVNFSADQIKVIQRLVETGDKLGAQRLIIAELDKEFGRSFLAQGNTTAGKVGLFKDAIEDLQRALATALLPTVGKVSTALQKFLVDPAVVQGAKDLGKTIASLFSDENLAAGADFLKGAFQTAKEAAPVVSAAAKATFSLIQSAVGLFKSLPPEVQKLAIGAFAINKLTGGLVTNLAGGLIGSVLKQLVSGVVNVKGAVVNVLGGPTGGAAGAAGAATGAVRGRVASVASAIGKVFLVGAAVGVFAELTNILGDQSRANKEQAAGLSEQTSLYVKSASIDQMKASLAALKDTSRYSLAEQLALNLNIDGVRDTIIAQQAQLEATIRSAEVQAATAQVRAIDRAESIASGKADQIRRASEGTRAAVRRAEAATNRTGRTVANKIVEAKRAQVAATRRTTLAIANKDLSVRVNVNVPPPTVSIRQVVNGTRIVSRYGSNVTRIS